MDDARKLALEFALEARTGPNEDVVALAERIHAFLRPTEVVTRFEIEAEEIDGIVAEVAAARAPEGLAKADQSPSMAKYSDAFEGARRVEKEPTHLERVYGVPFARNNMGHVSDFTDDDKTRIVRNGGEGA